MQESLTGREQEVLNMLLDGAAPKEIAFSLNISYDTVLTHQKSLYRKLEVHSLNELIGKYPPDNSDEQATKLQIKKILTFPLVCVFWDNSPWAWRYIVDPDLFFNGNEWKPSPFKLGKGNKITEGDEYIIEAVYTSNIDLDALFAVFVDNFAPAEDPANWNPLSEYITLNSHIKAHTKYSATLRLVAFKSSSQAVPEANVFDLVATPCEETRQPTLLFDNIEIVKVKI
jgi:DNA-binding CsgD family transcriptional regulator